MVCINLRMVMMDIYYCPLLKGETFIGVQSLYHLLNGVDRAGFKAVMIYCYFIPISPPLFFILPMHTRLLLYVHRK